LKEIVLEDTSDLYCFADRQTLRADEKKQLHVLMQYFGKNQQKTDYNKHGRRLISIIKLK